MTRFGRTLLPFVVAYFSYLLLLGPVWALDGRGLLPISAGVRSALWTPVMPLRDVPVVAHLLHAYFDCWFVDPITETTR